MSSTITGHVSNAIGEHLARLEAFEPGPFPVLSVYLNTQSDEHGRATEVTPYLHREFKALARTWAAGSPEQHSFERDAERIIAWVADSVEPATRGVAIFACWGAEEFFEAIQLTTPVGENYISVGNQPHLYHLARLDEHFPRYAAVLTDANTARIFVFGLGQTAEEEDLKGKKVHRVKVGGWSQARYQRRVGNAHHQHAKEVIERLVEVVRDEGINHIVLAGDQMALPLLEAEIPPEMLPMVKSLKLDVHASEQDVLAATLAALREDDAKSENEKVARLMQQYRAHRLAVLGPDETLQALANGQVDELLLSGSLEEAVGEEAVGEMREPNGEAGPVSLSDQLTAKARQTAATITFIEDPRLLEAVGGVGGFLRWRS